jgi:flagellar protein FlbD
MSRRSSLGNSPSLADDEPTKGLNAARHACARKSGCGMIMLTRLNNQSLTVNSDLIKFIEQSPDTVITLLNGEKLLVRESPVQVRERIVEFRRSVLQGVLPTTGCAPVAFPLPARTAEEPEEQRE